MGGVGLLVGYLGVCFGSGWLYVGSDWASLGRPLHVLRGGLCLPWGRFDYPVSLFDPSPTHNDWQNNSKPTLVKHKDVHLIF